MLFFHAGDSRISGSLIHHDLELEKLGNDRLTGFPQFLRGSDKFFCCVIGTYLQKQIQFLHFHLISDFQS